MEQRHVTGEAERCEQWKERVSVLPKPSFMAAITAGCRSWCGEEMGSAGGCVLRGERARCPACQSPEDTLVPGLSSSGLLAHLHSNKTQEGRKCGRRRAPV